MSIENTLELVPRDPASGTPDAAFQARYGTPFQARQGQSDASWTERSVERWRTRESLHGRDRPRDALNALGFELR